MPTVRYRLIGLNRALPSPPMVETISRVYTLLFAVGILLIGHGLQMTLLPVHALTLGWTSTQIGLTGSMYFLGFAAGCVMGPGAVARVGHIRVFMVMAAAATVALLLTSLLVSVWAWLVLRCVTGMALAGLYMVVESWLTDVCPAERRGTVLSIYLVVSLLGLAAGQLPMLLTVAGDIRLFVLAAALLSAAIIPIGLTTISSPKPIPAVQVTPRTLLRASRIAVVSVVLAGMVTGAFWVLGPVVGRAYGLNAGQVGLLISVGVLGGAASQYPIGRLSDRFDRRHIIALLALLGVGIAVFGFLLAGSRTWVLYAAISLLCAATMPMYAVCIALAAERTELTLVELAGGMLLANGLGSIVGPLVIAPVMTAFGARMFFLVSAVCLLLMAGWAAYRYLRSDRPGEFELHRPMLPRTTQAVAELADTETG